MNSADAQTIRDITYFTRALLSYADVLPSGLTTMLQDYESDLNKTSSSGRWQGIGNATLHSATADYIGQSITDGRLPEGKLLDDSSLGKWPYSDKARSVIENALLLVTMRGEVISRFGMYYVRSRNENSRQGNCPHDYPYG
jgi:hypothetical protein